MDGHLNPLVVKDFHFSISAKVWVIRLLNCCQEEAISAIAWYASQCPFHIWESKFTQTRSCPCHFRILCQCSRTKDGDNKGIIRFREDLSLRLWHVELMAHAEYKFGKEAPYLQQVKVKKPQPNIIIWLTNSCALLYVKTISSDYGRDALTRGFTALDSPEGCSLSQPPSWIWLGPH